MKRGDIYKDDDGIWKITAIYGSRVTIECIERDNPEYGEEFSVLRSEIEKYFQ